RAGRRAAEGARAADAPDDRERLRADRPDLTRRLEHGRRSSGGARGAPARADADLQDARRGDRVITLRTIAELRRALEPFRAGSTVGLVPTMGAYHEGHRALFRAARAEHDVGGVSLVVNPA